MRGFLTLCWNIGPRWVHVFAAKKKRRLSTFLRLCRSDLQKKNTGKNGIKFKRGCFDKIDRNTWTPDWGVQSNLSVRTPLYYGQFPVSRQNSHIFSLQNPLLYGLSLIRTTDTKSRPQRVNIHTNLTSLLVITDTAVIRWILNPDQVNLHRVSPVWLMSHSRWFQKTSRCISCNDLWKVYSGT